jgi:hypothetical protein
MWHSALCVVLLQVVAVAYAATAFPANTAVAHVDFSRQTSNLYVVSERIQYAMMETDIYNWNSARVREESHAGGALARELRRARQRPRREQMSSNQARSGSSSEVGGHTNQ